MSWSTLELDRIKNWMSVEEATVMLRTILEIIEKYGSISVGDCKEIFDMQTVTYSDYRIGWNSPVGIHIAKEESVISCNGDRYFISFPEPVMLKEVRE